LLGIVETLGHRTDITQHDRSHRERTSESAATHLVNPHDHFASFDQHALKAK
jgi:hypothetical protein